MSCGERGDRTRWELLPRDVQERNAAGAMHNDDGVSLMGLQVQPSDVFNLHTLGRSQKVDFLVPKVKATTEDDSKIFKWAYAMISNQHLKIYCTLSDTTPNDVSVWIEDTSGNGTMINQTTLLRRGERRLLNSGDEICVINPATLRRKIRSQTKLTQVLQQFSFVFVRQQMRPSLGSAVAFANFSSIPPWQPPPSSRKAAVNARATTGREPPTAKRVGPQCRRLEDDYEVRDLIGEGTAGTVRRAIHRRTGVARAVKVIRIQKRPFGGAAASALADVQAEAKILQEMSHPYVVKLDDFYVTDSAVYLVMELLAGGDLFDRIVDKGRYGETESRRVMRRILAAVYYLHEEQNVVHRDLKPENILLVSRKDDVQVKLTDFGLAKTVNDEGCKTFCGTPQYFAPEVLRRQHTVKGRGRYGKPADMWSIGVILYVLLSGTQPFEEELTVTFPEADWHQVSAPARDLVRRLLQPEAGRRLTIQQACEHEWILMEDGDTHTHPLRDPMVLSTAENEKGAEKSDAIGNNAEAPNQSDEAMERAKDENAVQGKPVEVGSTGDNEQTPIQPNKATGEKEASAEEEQGPDNYNDKASIHPDEVRKPDEKTARIQENGVDNGDYDPASQQPDSATESKEASADKPSPPLSQTYVIESATVEGTVGSQQQPEPFPASPSPPSVLDKIHSRSDCVASTATEEESEEFDNAIKPRKSARVSDETEARRPLSPTSFNTRSASAKQELVVSRVPRRLANDEEIESFGDDAEESISSFSTTDEEKKALVVAAKRELLSAPTSKKRKRRRTQAAKGDSLADLAGNKQTTLFSWIKSSGIKKGN